MKRLIIYVIINAGILNILWAAFFLIGSNIGAKRVDFFNTYVEPIFDYFYILLVLGSFIILLLGLIASKKKGTSRANGTALWISVLCPLAPVLFVLLLFLFGKGDIYNLIGTLLDFGLFVINYKVAQPFLRNNS